MVDFKQKFLTDLANLEIDTDILDILEKAFVEFEFYEGVVAIKEMNLLSESETAIDFAQRDAITQAANECYSIEGFLQKFYDIRDVVNTYKHSSFNRF